MTERVEIPVRIPLQVDTTAAEDAIRRLPDRVRQAAQQTASAEPMTAGQKVVKQEIELQGRVHEKLKEQLGTQFSWIKNKKEINTLYREELTHVRTMEENFARLKQSKHGLDDTQLKSRARDVREARHFVNRLRDTIAVETAKEGLRQDAESVLGSGVGRGGVFSGLTFQQAISGGAVASAGRGLGSLIMSHPLLALLTGSVGVAALGAHYADEFARPSEERGLAFLNLARRTGMSRQIRGAFSNRIGETDREFLELGFTEGNLAPMAAAYGMPAREMPFRRALLGQAQFARAFGFGDQPEMISAMGRRMTQLGVAEPQEQTDFWRSMTAAVKAGMKQGVDASETMRSVVGLTERAAAVTGISSPRYFAGLAGIQASVEAGGTRFFKGEQGAQNLDVVLSAFQRPKSIAHERLLENAIMGHFGGRVPTADDLGLGGDTASAYGRMPAVQRMQAVMQLLPELLASGSAQAKGLLGGLAGQSARMAGPGGEMLLMQAMTGMESSRLLKMSESLTQSVREAFGEGEASRLAGLPLSMLHRLFEGGSAEQTSRMLFGSMPDTQTSRVEHLYAQQAQTSESFSRQVADMSVAMTLREGATGLKEAANRLLALARGELSLDSLIAPLADRIGQAVSQGLASVLGRWLPGGALTPHDASPGYRPSVQGGGQ